MVYKVKDYIPVLETFNLIPIYLTYLIFFNYMDLKKVEIDRLDKIILRKSCFIVAFEVLNGRIEPDRFGKVEFKAYFIQSAKYFMSARIVAAVLDDGVLYHMVVSKFFCP